MQSFSVDKTLNMLFTDAIIVFSKFSQHSPTMQLHISENCSHRTTIFFDELITLEKLQFLKF